MPMPEQIAYEAAADALRKAEDERHDALIEARRAVENEWAPKLHELRIKLHEATQARDAVLVARAKAADDGFPEGCKVKRTYRRRGSWYTGIGREITEHGVVEVFEPGSRTDVRKSWQKPAVGSKIVRMRLKGGGLSVKTYPLKTTYPAQWEKED